MTHAAKRDRRMVLPLEEPEKIRKKRDWSYYHPRRESALNCRYHHSPCRLAVHVVVGDD